jgi:hypothetical protein
MSDDGRVRARTSRLAPSFACGALIIALGASLAAQPSPQNYKGLEVSVTGVERAINVSLADCPAGANTVRGVIKPGDTNEFASIKVDFKVTPAFKPTVILKPVLYDEAGKPYNTAQAFGEIGVAPDFSCTFSFRVPKGTKLKRFAIDTLSIDLDALAK